MQTLLKIENLSLGYGSRVIFKNINASENEGSLIGLIGSNGRGKSTLLRTIAGLEEIYCGAHTGQGSVLFEGKPAADYSRAQMSSMVSFVEALTERASYLKVIDMLSINSYFRTNWIGTVTPMEIQKMRSALEMVGLPGFEERACTSLSDGEYQRVTIAGAIVQDSRIILLDEPTAFLDVQNKFLITKMLRDIAHRQCNEPQQGSGSKLIIFSTHDLRLAMEVCDRLWIMASDGFYHGTPEQLIEADIPQKMFDVEGVKFDKRLKSFTFSK